MIDIAKILDKRGAEAVAEIKQNIVDTGANTTGKTANSVYYKVTQQGDRTVLEVVGARAFFPAIETGSKPSKKNPSPDMIKSLTEWAQAKGMEKEAAWPIAKTILRDGSKLWQSGGRKTIYTNVRDSIMKAVLDDFRKAMRDDTKKGLIPSEAKFQ